MDDSQIVDLYWLRSETAIGETEKKYSRYCSSIAANILHSGEDAEECVNDTWLRAWNTMPPKRPNSLATFLGKITRNLSLDKYRQYSAEKRGRGQLALALEELDEVIPSAAGTEQAADENELAEIIDSFLEGLPKQKRVLFVQRYWYVMPVREMAEHAGTSESQVKSALFRVRNELKQYLEEEGVSI